jgi:hypothetical protein
MRFYSCRFFILPFRNNPLFVTCITVIAFFWVYTYSEVCTLRKTMKRKGGLKTNRTITNNRNEAIFILSVIIVLALVSVLAA